MLARTSNKKNKPKFLAVGKLFEIFELFITGPTAGQSKTARFSMLQYAILNPYAASYFQLDVTTDPGVV